MPLPTEFLAVGSNALKFMQKHMTKENFKKASSTVRNLYGKVSQLKSKAESMNIFAEDIVQTFMYDPKSASCTLAVALDTLNSKSPAEQSSFIEAVKNKFNKLPDGIQRKVSDFLTKSNEGNAPKDNSALIGTKSEKKSDEDKPKDLNEDRPSETKAISAESSTSDNKTVTLEQFDERTNQIVKEQLGVQMDEFKKLISELQSALCAAITAQGKDVDKMSGDEYTDILNKVVKTTEDLIANEEAMKPDEKVKETPKTQPQRQRQPLQPAPKAEETRQPVEEDIDYSSLESIKVYKIPSIITLYFAAVFGADICGFPVISGTIGFPLMLIGLPCMYYFYGTMCYRNYSIAKQGAGMSIDKLSLIEKLKSKPFAIFGGTIIGGMLCGFIGGLNIFAHFSVWVVLIVISIAIYFMSHFMCKDSIFDVGGLSKEQASDIRNKEDRNLEAKRRAKKAAKNKKNTEKEETKKQNRTDRKNRAIDSALSNRNR